VPLWRESSMARWLRVFFREFADDGQKTLQAFFSTFSVSIRATVETFTRGEVPFITNAEKAVTPKWNMTNLILSMSMRNLSIHTESPARIIVILSCMKILYNKNARMQSITFCTVSSGGFATE
jgi:hypothetical protein